MDGVSGTGRVVQTNPQSMNREMVVKKTARAFIEAFHQVNDKHRQNNAHLQNDSRSSANRVAVKTDYVAGNQYGWLCDRRELRTFAVDDFTSKTSVFQKSDTMDLLRNMIMSQVPIRDDYSPYAHFGGQLIKELARSTKFDFLRELVKKLDQGSPEDRELVGHLLKAIAAEANQDHKSAIEALKPTQGK